MAVSDVAMEDSCADGASGTRGREARVLSVQSHVVHGYVGNRAAVFPLQLLGFEVDVINSVQFSCHTGYPAIRGQRLGGEDLRTLAEGLEANGVLDHTHLLTGYIGTPSFLHEVVRLLDMLPKTCCYVCDPVLGDNGKLYTSEELIGLYRAEVLPRVSVLTPNQFEAELLTERPISNVSEAAQACDALHKLGPRTVVLTTLDVPDATEGGQLVAMMLSEVGRQKWLLRLPFIAGGPFTGTGDLTASMLLAWLHLHPHEAPAALEKAGAVLQAVIAKTVESDAARDIGGKRVPPELRILRCKRVIEEPPVVHRCRLVTPLTPPVRGLVFDMDGTLTLPGQIDFRRMRERAGVPQGVDIVPYLRDLHRGNPAALAVAMAAVDEEERRAFDPPALQPGLKAAVEQFQRRGLRLGLVTRNSQDCVALFLRHAGLPEGTFAPVVTRESPMENKPDPAPVLHCCAAWGLEPTDVIMVGDMLDDLRCGRSAGSRTVVMLSAPDASGGGPRLTDEAALVEVADFKVSSLGGLERLLPPF